MSRGHLGKFLLFGFLLFFSLIKESDADFLEASCGKKNSLLVYEEKSRKVLIEQDSVIRVYPASLTKLMTLYLTFEAIENKKIKLDQKIKISARAEEISQVNKVNTLKLLEGDEILVKEAIEAIVTKSFNEAAIALAELISQNEWDFVRLMNKKAQKLEMFNSSFRNSTGLHEEGQYTTARDLARLTLALKNDFPQFYKFFALQKFFYRKELFKSHNRVLLEFDGAEGMKTGFTKASGFNLISSAKRDGKRIFAVLTSCESVDKRNNLMKLLLELGFYDLETETDYGHSRKVQKIVNRNFYEDYDQLKDTYYEDRGYLLSYDN